MDIVYYGQRLLNPFRGVVHTIRYDSAEAVTLDGEHWEIYVSNDTLRQGLDSRKAVQISDIRYGSWSAVNGLKRGPLYPSEDFRRMEQMGHVVFEHLLHLHRRIPFAFRDRHELWLLDDTRQPLALLHSVVSANDIELDLPIEWRAGFAARERFSSDAPVTTATEAASDYLTRYINARAGAIPAAQWFRRESDGSGTGLKGMGLPAALDGRTVECPAFPPLHLSVTGHDDVHHRLVEDYLAWQSPWLLLLPDLDGDTRVRLEQLARQQALEVLKQYRLYPEIVDEEGLKAVLVEAVLRRSQLSPTSHGESMTTFYIELNPSGAE
jgi:hypothetical protein